MKYALIDTANMFFRAKHVASRNNDSWEKVGMALHLIFASANQMVRKFNVDHVIFCLEGHSWRKDFYKSYKANRVITHATEKEKEEADLFWETYSAFTTFITEKTNVSVIRDKNAEADDIIARFIHLHPNDEHFIISTDTDFIQLISENVHQYNAVTNQFIKSTGYFDDKDRPIKDKKTKEIKLLESPDYLLFKKIIRGDVSDNVFSAYPGVRENGSSKSVGIREAYNDKDKQGFAWNNLMLQQWTDHEGNEHQVRDDYERNRVLIDLSAQPKTVKESVDAAIVSGLNVDFVPNVGFYFLKFCGKYELTKLSENSETYTKWLNKSYSGELIDEKSS
jgi:5'-3' exonuclease